jgi:hypothetical protein
MTPMKFKTFENLMTRLLEIKKDEQNLNKAFNKFDPDFNHLGFGRYETLVVDIIKEALGDKNDWVGFFLYEMGGRFSKKTMAWNGDKPIPLRNMKDLYNVIYDKHI